MASFMHLLSDGLTSQARVDVADFLSGAITDGMSFAADTLRKLLTAKSEMVRLSAARSVLELGVKLRESVELEQRISAIEQAQTRITA